MMTMIRTHSVKQALAIANIGTYHQLHSSNIFRKNASFQIGRGAHTEFHLVSPLSSRIISDLCESALNSNRNAV